MNKLFKKTITIFFFSFFALSQVSASLLWDINIGIDKFRKNDYKNALCFFQEYISSNPNDKNGYYWLAKTYWELKEPTKAKENFKKAYELTFEEKNIEKIDFNIENISTMEDYFDMAAMFFEDKNYSEAETYADMMLQINPKSPSAYFIKAKIALLEDREKEATDYLNQAILLNNKLIKTNLAKSLKITQIPDISQELYGNFALENYFSNDIGAAIKYFRKYLSI